MAGLHRPYLLGTELGVEVDKWVDCSAYAHDLALLTDEEPQHLVDMVWEWCRKWRLQLNAKNSKATILSQRGSAQAALD